MEENTEQNQVEQAKKKSLFVKNTKVAADFVIAIFLIIVSVIFFISSTSLPTKAQGIGPGAYPQFLCLILFILGIIQIINSVFLVGGIPVVDTAKINKREMVRVLIVVLASYLFYKLLKPVGFLIVAPIYLFFTICFFGHKNKLKAAIFSVVFSTGVYFLFTKVFLVMLPAGILG